MSYLLMGILNVKGVTQMENYKLIDPYKHVECNSTKKEVLSRPELLGGNVKLLQGNICNDTEKILKKLRKKTLKGMKKC